MSSNRLRFDALSDRHPGVTPGISAGYHEAARVCLSRHHASPQQMLLRNGKAEAHGDAEWVAPDTRLLNGWNNQDDATEQGAYGLALAAAELTRGMVAVRRAETRTGSDYYLAMAGEAVEDLEASVRLEVSGTDQGGESVINSRLKQKLEQAAKGNSNLPAIATIVGFSALTILSADLEA